MADLDDILKRIDTLEESDRSQQTSINAAAQAYQALKLAEKTKSLLKELDRKFNGAVCIAIGCLSVNAAIINGGNHDLALPLLGMGGGSLLLGMLVLTGYDEKVIPSVIEAVAQKIKDWP